MKKITQVLLIALCTALFASCACEQHMFSEWETTLEPTCSMEGTKERACTECSHKETEAIEAIAHTFGEWEQTTDPTCSTKGVEISKCTVCGAEETREVETLPHTADNWQVTKNSTCSEAGIETGTCTVCSAEVTRELPTTEHFYLKWDVTTLPTCTGEGVQSATCRFCSHVENKPYKARGHQYTKKIIQWGSCEADGIYEYVCIDCDDKYTETVKAEHSWSAPVLKEHEMKVPPEDFYNPDAHRCDYCNARLLGGNIDWEEELTMECRYEKKCTTCGDTEYELIKK